jgi:hypothetical protein
MVDIVTQVEAVKIHAHEHYEESGWDEITERWEDDEIVAELRLPPRLFSTRSPKEPQC